MSEPVIHTIPDPGDAPRAELHTVQILAAPLLLWEASAAHTAELMRELALVKIGADTGADRRLPERLLGLIADLRARYAGVSARQSAQFERALADGLSHADFSYDVPASVAPACRTLLEEADEYCADGDTLITLVSPPEQRAFRAWYLQEFVRQVQGGLPQAWSGPAG